MEAPFYWSLKLNFIAPCYNFTSLSNRKQMGSTLNSKQQQLPLTSWRRAIVQKILNLPLGSNLISRTVQFTAIAILDYYLKICEQKKSHVDSRADQIFPFCTALICLSTKYCHRSVPKIKELSQSLGWRKDPNDLKKQWHDAEALIFTTINFEIPTQTAFSKLLEIEQTSEEDLQAKKSTLKLLLYGLYYSGELSAHKQYSLYIYQRLFRKSTYYVIDDYVKRLLCWKKAVKNFE